MRGSPEMRRRRVAEIRRKMTRRPSGIAAVREIDHDSGSCIETFLPDGSTRPATPAERAWWAAGEPPAYFAITTDGRVIDTGDSGHRVARTTREQRSPSTTRTTSRRARTSATSSADPSSSRVRLSADALGALRIETTRLGLRLALLGIGGAR